MPGQTRLHVLHVIEPHWVPEEPVPYGQAMIEFYDAKGDGTRDEILRRRMREMYAPNLPIDVEYHIREGEAPAEILHVAGQLHTELIVVGTHGRTGLSWLLAGSVATSMIRRASCPVLALHRPEEPRTLEDIRVVLHPTDFSAGCEHSLQVARSIARDLGARLVLLHVVPFGFYANDMTVPVDPGVYREALMEEWRLVDAPDLKYPVETRLARGDAAEEILRAAAELVCGLIVMGTHGRAEPAAHGQRHRIRRAPGGLPGAGRQDSPGCRSIPTGADAAARRRGALSRNRRPRPPQEGGSSDERLHHPPHREQRPYGERLAQGAGERTGVGGS